MATFFQFLVRGIEVLALIAIVSWVVWKLLPPKWKKAMRPSRLKAVPWSWKTIAWVAVGILVLGYWGGALWAAAFAEKVHEVSYENLPYFQDEPKEEPKKEEPPASPWEPEKLKQKLLMQAASNGRAASSRDSNIHILLGEESWGQVFTSDLNYAFLEGVDVLDIEQPRYPNSYWRRYQVRARGNPDADWYHTPEWRLDTTSVGAGFHTLQFQGMAAESLDSLWQIYARAKTPQDGAVYVHTDYRFQYEGGQDETELVLPWHDLPRDFKGHTLTWVCMVKFLKVVDQGKGWYAIPDPAEVTRPYPNKSTGAAVIFGTDPDDWKLCLEHTTVISSAEAKAPGMVEIVMPSRNPPETWLVQVAVKITRQ